MNKPDRKPAPKPRRPLGELLDAITESWFCAECGAESDKPLPRYHPARCGPNGVN